MEQATKALVAGAGVAGAVATVARRRWTEHAHPGDIAVATITVLRPVDEVARAWDANVGGNGDVGAPIQVEFVPAPGDRGTEVRARMTRDADGDGVTDRLRGEAGPQRLREKLRRFKAAIESGEVITTEGQPSGRGPMAEGLTRAVTRRLRAWSAP